MPQHTYRRDFSALCFQKAATFLSCLAATALAPVHAAWPDKPIRLVVPYAAAGGGDVVARTVAAEMSKGLGQQVVVDNRPGAGGVVGGEFVARSAPDGYTILLGGVTFVTIALIYPKLSFDPSGDFAQIGLVADIPNVFAVNADSSYKNLADVLRAARANPGGVAYASAGNGTPGHLVCEQLSALAAVHLTHVAYKGNAPAVNDVAGGQVPTMCNNLAGTLPFLKSGKLRMLAVTGKSRSPAAPDVPTFTEAGVPGLEGGVWLSLLAPAATPKPVLVRLGEELNRALGSQAVRERFVAVGAVPIPSTPEAAAARVQHDLSALGPIVKKLNLKPE